MKIAIKREQSPNLFEALSSAANLREAKRNIPTIVKIAVWILGLALVLGACKKDEDEVDLRLDKSTLEVYTDGIAGTVKIESGNGGYVAKSSADQIATASVSGQTVTITGKTKGEATITITDSAGKTAAVKVNVKQVIIDTVIPRFKWGNTVIELEKTNSWGYAVLADCVAVTNLAEKKQYILSWKGGYSVGEKTEAKLRTIEKDKESIEIVLTSMEIQQAESTRYSIVFDKNEEKGELVFTKSSPSTKDQ
ncbi:MAG: hypothetical protein AB2L20_12460 [Mangrovibacterium sp.]